MTPLPAAAAAAAADAAAAVFMCATPALHTYARRVVCGPCPNAACEALRLRIHAHARPRTHAPGRTRPPARKPIRARAHAPVTADILGVLQPEGREALEVPAVNGDRYLQEIHSSSSPSSLLLLLLLLLLLIK